jgi:predicted transcriptional regulator with HTH domain
MQPNMGMAHTTTASFHRLGLNSRLNGNRSFIDGGSGSVSMLNHQTVFKVNPTNVNISEILKGKEGPTKNYLS